MPLKNRLCALRSFYAFVISLYFPSEKPEGNTGEQWLLIVFPFCHNFVHNV